VGAWAFGECLVKRWEVKSVTTRPEEPSFIGAASSVLVELPELSSCSPLARKEGEKNARECGADR
jgi:hypothetical protein